MSLMVNMLHMTCSSVNGTLQNAVHSPFMDSVWTRITRKIGSNPQHTGREVAWLAENLKLSIQTVNNWKLRGVPTDRFEAIARVLGWTIDEVAGRKMPPRDPWPFERVDQAEWEQLSERQKGVVEQAMLDALALVKAPSKKQHGSR